MKSGVVICTILFRNVALRPYVVATRPYEALPIEGNNTLEKNEIDGHQAIKSNIIAHLQEATSENATGNAFGYPVGRSLAEVYHGSSGAYAFPVGMLLLGLIVLIVVAFVVTRPVADSRASSQNAGAGKAATAERDSKSLPEPLDEKKVGQLLVDYALGEVLGQGACGIVYDATKKDDGKVYAVKMIDMVETKLTDIEREVDLLTQLAHPNVVQLHSVYYEKVFVCMVMEKYRGGDLVDGMQAHWENKGMIPVQKIPYIAKQMVCSIAWLHSKNFVHRDVKADNFLSDRKDILDPDCLVFLADFGTVAEVLPAGKRLRDKCGTFPYWAPEFVRLNYSLKVDVWAVGVTVHGLVLAKFPFKNNQDIMSKNVVFPKWVPEDCASFLQGMLDKSEEQRFDAAQALASPWIRAGATSEAEGSSEMGSSLSQQPVPGEGIGFNEAGEHLNDRRRDLVERLQHAIVEKQSTAQHLSTASAGWRDVLKVNKKAGGYTVMTFLSASDVEQGRILDAYDNAKPAPTDNKVDVDVVKKMLEEFGVSTSMFGIGTAKDIKDLAREMSKGTARLMLDASQHRHLVRVVDLVILRITYGTGKDKKYLVHIGTTFADGRRGDKSHSQLPANKKRPHENAITCAQRQITNRLDMGDCGITFSCRDITPHEKKDDSQSYPGLSTVYKEQWVEGEVTTADESVLRRVGILGGVEYSSTDVAAGGKTPQGYSATDADGEVRLFEWLSEAEFADKGTVLFPGAPEMSTLIQPPIAFDEQILTSYFEGMGQDVSWGNKALRQFGAELANGEATLEKQPDGSLLRVVSVAAVKIVRPSTKQVLVETEKVTPDGSSTKTNRLPATKMRPDENQFSAAYRMIQADLRLDEHFVNINGTDVRLVEEVKESLGYGGLKTKYCMSMMSAEVIEDPESHFSGPEVN